MPNDPTSAAHDPATIQRRAVEQYRPGELYVPTLGLLPLHQSTARLRFVRKPNQVGGTTALVYEIWLDALRIHPLRPKIPSGHPFLVMIKDLDAGYAGFCDRLWDVGWRDQLHPDCRYLANRGFYVGGRRLLKLKNGQAVEFRSGTQNLQALESITAAAGYIDEPPRERHFAAFVQRLAFTGGPCTMQFTPINAGDLTWLKLMIEGDSERKIPPKMNWDQIVPKLTVEDCTTIHGVVIRSAQNISDAIASMNPWEIAQRRDGAWSGTTAGRRFVAFTPAHLFDDFEDLPAFDYIRIGIDHGEGDGKQIVHAVGVLEAEKRYTVLGEWSSVGVSTPSDVGVGVRAILSGVGISPFSVGACYGDSNSAGFLGEGRKYNEFVEEAIAVAYGHHAAPFAVLTPSKGRGSVSSGEAALHHALVEGRLSIHSSCTRLINSLQNYTGPKDRDLKDPIDALRYSIHDLLLAVDSAPQVWRTS